MSAAPHHAVIDASAGIQLFVAEEHSENVTEIFARVEGDPPLDLHVPDLFYIECTNVLLKLARRANRAHAGVVESLKDLQRLSLHVTSTADLMDAAYQIAAQTGLTAYDACYVALAAALKAPLLTVDGEMLALSPFEDVKIMTPGDWLARW